MGLEHAKNLFSSPPDTLDGMSLLVDVLAASIELVSLDGNDFTWSSWPDRESAKHELSELLESVREGRIPQRLSVSVLYAATGPMQALSMSSGWVDTFVKLAGYFDAAENVLWPH